MQVPFRLVTAELVRGVTLCALCGPSPSLPEIQSHAMRHWRGAQPLLASLHSVLPRGFPPAAAVDQSILA